MDVNGPEHFLPFILKPGTLLIHNTSSGLSNNEEDFKVWICIKDVPQIHIDS